MPWEKWSVISMQWSVKKQLRQSAHCALLTAHSQKGIAQWALLLVVLVGIAVGVYAIQNQTNLIPHAADNSPAQPPTPQGTVTNKGNVESINPGATAAKDASGLTTAKIVTRQQTDTTDGYLIHFVWSDGRESWDAKDSTGQLIKSKSYAIRNGKKSVQVGSPVTNGAKTLTTVKWDDGTTEYNVFGADGKYNVSASYSICCTKATPKPTKTPTPKPASQGSSSSGGGSKPATGSFGSVSTGGTTTPTTTTPVTSTSQTNASLQTTLTQFQTLKQVFNSTIVAAEASPGATLNIDDKARLDDLINKTNQSIDSGIQATQSCMSSNSTTCAVQITPLLQYSKTAARLSAFSAIFARIPQICTRADFGITPEITGTSSDGITGPIYLCTGAVGTDQKWRIFDSSNNPHTLSDADAATWKPLSSTPTSAVYPQAFQAKFSAANQIVNPINPSIYPQTTPSPNTIL